MQTTEAGIATLWLGQLYISISDPAADGSLPVRAYWKPLVTLIWLGAVLMAFGGALSSWRCRRGGRRWARWSVPRLRPPWRQTWRRSGSLAMGAADMAPSAVGGASDVAAAISGPSESAAPALGEACGSDPFSTA